MTASDIDDYMKLLMRYKLHIPLDHEYEAVIDEYSVVPLIWFTTENGTWDKCTLLCIPDDNTGYSQDLFMSRLERAYQEKQHWRATRILYENAENIRSVWAWTYKQLRIRLWVIEPEETYNFRYIFHSVHGTIQDAILVVDRHPVHRDRFEVLDMNEHESWEMSPVVDNGKTMKRNLEEMANLLERIRNGVEQQTIKVVQLQKKNPIDIGYDDEEVSETNY